MSYLLTTYHWPLLSCPQVAGFRCPVTSLDLVELVMAIEEEFSTPLLKVEIPDEDAEGITTIQDAVDYLKDLGVDEQMQ